MTYVKFPIWNLYDILFISDVPLHEFWAQIRSLSCCLTRLFRPKHMENPVEMAILAPKPSPKD